MRAVWVPLAGAFAVAVTTIAVLPSDTEAHQGATIQVAAAPGEAPVAQPSPAAKPGAPSQAPAPAAKPAAPAQAPAAQPSPAAKPAAPAQAPAPAAKPAAPAQAPRPAASPAALPRTGEADPTAGLWMAVLGGVALVGSGAFVLARRRGSA